MSARDVADMLAVAHVGHAEARRTNDAELLAHAHELAALALAHPDAATFFTGLQVALAETFDVDTMDDPFDPLGREHPRVRDAGDDPLPTRGDIRDGVVATNSPVDSSALPHDGLVTRDDRRNAERLRPAIAGLVIHRRDPAEGARRLRERAAENLR